MRGVKKDEDVVEFVRTKIVSGMRVGKPVIICCGEEMPDFKEKYALPEKWGITWEEVFDWDSFREKENYMKLVKPGENYDRLVNKGKFEMDPEFNITFMARYVKEGEFHQLLNCIPKSKDMMKIAITNV